MNFFRAVGWAGYGLLVGVCLALPVFAGEPTAYDLIKEGNKYVGEHAKDKVVQIRSEKSIGGLSPTIWYIVYYDHTAALKAAEVKFGGGKFLDLKRPLRLLEPVTDKDEPLDRAKFKIDSDQAIEIARKEPILDKLELKASQLKLDRGPLGVPVWKVKLFAARLRKPTEQVDIGEVHIAADDGKVIKNDLRINRVDR
jgi:hypothetical protein